MIRDRSSENHCRRRAAPVGDLDDCVRDDRAGFFPGAMLGTIAALTVSRYFEAQLSV